jgi:hypothetical protein
LNDSVIMSHTTTVLASHKASGRPTDVTISALAIDFSTSRHRYSSHMPA